MCSHRWHNLIVQIRHQFRRLFFQSLGDIRYRTIEARGRLFSLAVEFGHTHPCRFGLMFTRELRLPSLIIIVGLPSAVNRLCVETKSRRAWRWQSPIPHTNIDTATVQSRHASETRPGTAPRFYDVCFGLHVLWRTSRAYLVRSNWRRGSGARLLEKCASCELGGGGARPRFELCGRNTQRDARSIGHA